VPLSQLEEVDRYILARYAEVGLRVLDAYDAYDYGPLTQALTQFATVDLSAFYNDICKDRMYTFARKSPERRSGQTAMYLMADGLARLLAPVLSFTSDEAWRYLPGAREESVHMAVFPARADLEAMRDETLVDEWNYLVTVREKVLAKIEPLRKNKEIGSSLQAKAVISETGQLLPRLQRHAHHLPMLFIVSDVELRAGESLDINIERATGVKCERCWRYVPAVSGDPQWAGLCSRCQDALSPGDQAA
jgi:isoleucyl-tRNA synthetase